MKPVMTEAGLKAMIRGMSGEKFKFTKIALGNSKDPYSADPKDAVSLKSWKENIPIDSVSVESSGDYIQINAIYTNAGNDKSYIWREVGIYCSCGDDADEYLSEKPKKDILYAYGHVRYSKDKGVAIRIPESSNEIFEMRFRYHVFVSGAYTVDDDTVSSIEEKYESEYQDRWEKHINNINNPHNVTASQAGINISKINEALNIKDKSNSSSSEDDITVSSSTNIIYKEGDHEVSVDDTDESLKIVRDDDIQIIYED